MSNFQNEFSWSPSRHRMFDSCKRQYYFNYYGSWGGWDKNADAQTQLLYRLKKITTVPQLIGTVVHDAISNTLNALKLGRDILPFAVETYAQNLFRQHLQESKDHHWRYSASRYTNLFEHYYNEPFTETDQVDSTNHISTSLNAFFASDAYTTLQTARPEDYLTIEDLKDFTLANTKIWVVLDVAIRRDKSVYIFDWKTGRERQADRHQLAVYALYATSQWRHRIIRPATPGHLPANQHRTHPTPLSRRPRPDPYIRHRERPENARPPRRPRAKHRFARRLSNDDKHPPVYHLSLQSRVLSPRQTCQTTHHRTRPRSTLTFLILL